MTVVGHKSAREFLDRAGMWLEQAEIENNLILGIASYLVSHVGDQKRQPYFLTIEDQGAITGTALMTPPRRLLITASYLLKTSANEPSRECAR